jgi:hypothetical protein
MTSTVHAQIGMNLLELSRPGNWGPWLTRRIEYVRFLDETSYETRVSVHLRIQGAWQDPQFAAALYPRWDGYLLLPIARLRKRDSINIELFDEQGAALPRLTKEEEREFLVAAITRLAEQTLGRAPDAQTVKVVEDVARSTTDFSTFTGSPAPELITLAADPVFRSLVEELSESFLLIASVHADAGQPRRRVLGYRYRKALPLPSSSSPFLRRQVAALSRLWHRGPELDLPLEVPAAGDCASYHLEIEAPEYLRVESELRVSFGAGRSDVILDDDPSPSSAHMYLSTDRVVQKAVSEVKVTPQARGFVVTAFWSSAFIAASLVFGAVFVNRHRDDPQPGEPGYAEALNVEAATTLLLLLPAVLATALAVPVRHDITDRLLRTTRVSVVMASLALYVAAAGLALDADGWLAVGIWVSAACVAGLCWLLLAVQLKRVQR